MNKNETIISWAWAHTDIRQNDSAKNSLYGAVPRATHANHKMICLEKSPKTRSGVVDAANYSDRRKEKRHKMSTTATRMTSDKRRLFENVARRTSTVFASNHFAKNEKENQECFEYSFELYNFISLVVSTSQTLIVDNFSFHFIFSMTNEDHNKIQNIFHFIVNAECQIKIEKTKSARVKSLRFGRRFDDKLDVCMVDFALLAIAVGCRFDFACLILNAERIVVDQIEIASSRMWNTWIFKHRQQPREWTMATLSSQCRCYHEM